MARSQIGNSTTVNVYSTATTSKSDFSSRTRAEVLLFCDASRNTPSVHFRRKYSIDVPVEAVNANSADDIINASPNRTKASPGVS
jgi:hypothetical protein